MNFRDFKLFTLFLALGIFIACGDDDSDTSPVETNIIDDSGGTVSSENNDVSIVIPAGALSTPTEITIEATTNHPANSIGVVYDLGPDGTTFNSPVALTFSYDEAALPSGTDESDLVIAFAENGSWMPLTGNAVDVDENTVTATTTHFTPFGVIVPQEGVEEGEPPMSLTYIPDGYPFVPNQTFVTPGASVSGLGGFIFSIAGIEPDFVTENFSINSVNGIITLENLTNDASEITLDISVANDFGQITTENALTFSLVSLNYTLEKTVYFPGTAFDSGTPEANNIPESFTYHDLAKVVEKHLEILFCRMNAYQPALLLLF